MRTQAEKAAAFRALHQRPGCFIIPNPWDAGTAKLLAALGFEALATTSLGVANMLGRADSAVSRAEVIANCREIVEATDLPVNADLENGFAQSRRRRPRRSGSPPRQGRRRFDRGLLGRRQGADLRLRSGGGARARRRRHGARACRCRSCSRRGRRT